MANDIRNKYIHYIVFLKEEFLITGGIVALVYFTNPKLIIGCSLAFLIMGISLQEKTTNNFHSYTIPHYRKNFIIAWIVVCAILFLFIMFLALQLSIGHIASISLLNAVLFLWCGYSGATLVGMFSFAIGFSFYFACITKNIPNQYNVNIAMASLGIVGFVVLVFNAFTSYQKTQRSIFSLIRDFFTFPKNISKSSYIAPNKLLAKINRWKNGFDCPSYCDFRILLIPLFFCIFLLERSTINQYTFKRAIMLVWVTLASHGLYMPIRKLRGLSYDFARPVARKNYFLELGLAFHLYFLERALLITTMLFLLFSFFSSNKWQMLWQFGFLVLFVHLFLGICACIEVIIRYFPSKKILAGVLNFSFVLVFLLFTKAALEIRAVSKSYLFPGDTAIMFIIMAILVNWLAWYLWKNCEVDSI